MINAFFQLCHLKIVEIKFKKLNYICRTAVNSIDFNLKPTFNTFLKTILEEVEFTQNGRFQAGLEYKQIIPPPFSRKLSTLLIIMAYYIHCVPIKCS